jgi:protein tyrosine phosphatase (PTP) superfamily phosphohydrolase (DUF442 family)
VTSQFGGYAPLPMASAQPTWQPVEGTVRLDTPQPNSADEIARLQPRESPRLVVPPVTPQPLPKAESGPASFPVGIPQFAVVREGVASGLRPLDMDGLNWLKENKYRTVLHLRPAGADDKVDARQFEKRGLKFLSLEVSAKDLDQKLVDEFNRIVGDKESYPLFVYDKDGGLAGPLWYLHFRTAEMASHDEALVRARQLGLREDQEEQRTMWLAVQKFLSK